MIDDRAARLSALRAAAEEIADPTTALGREARMRLPKSTGLSPEGVEFALSECLEHRAPRSALSGLLKRSRLVKQSHVLLSSNVFVGAFRAIALALSQSPQVYVRASSREPVMAELLLRGSGGAFELVSTLDPMPGDHLWVYGSDETVRTVKKTLVSGVHLHKHGFGMGVAVFRESPDMAKGEIAPAVQGLAQDIVAFDQRGCLSPRILLVQGSQRFAESVCDTLVDALDRLETQIPRGTLSPSELKDAMWHEATFLYLGSSVRAGKGLVHLDPVPGRLIVPPTGRYLHVTTTNDVLPLLSQIKERITSVGFFNPGALIGQLHEALGPRRYVGAGEMQKPAFDGPVDLRVGLSSELT